MSTVVNSMSNMYYDFYVGDEFSMDGANRILGKYDDVDRRVSYIKAVYETVLGSSIINETSKILIKSRKTYAEVARYYNCLHEQEIKRTKEAETRGERISCPVHRKTEALVKADVCYTNKRLKNVLGCNIPQCPKQDFFSVMLWVADIDDSLWERAEDGLKKLKALCNGSLLPKEAFWLNIPVREFHTELTEQEFNHLVDLVKPYFTAQKALAQQELNGLTREAGYLNYILRADMELNELDSSRRDYLLALTEGSTVKDYKEKSDPEQPVTDSELVRLQNELSQLEEVASMEKQERVNVMSRIGFIYYSNKTGNLNEQEITLLEALKIKYEQQKQKEVVRMERIRMLQNKIENLTEQDPK